MVARKLAGEVGKALGPIQQAVGVSSGCEIIARSMQLIYDMENEDSCSTEADDFKSAFVAIDIKNAFNSIPRKHIMTALQDERYGSRGLIPFFGAFYGLSRPLRDSKGVHVGECEMGVAQGDPLGMMYFCLGIAPMYEQMETCLVDAHFRLRDTEAVGSFLYPGGLSLGVSAFADDANLYGDVRTLTEALPEITRIAEDFGMQINANKSTLVCKSVPDWPVRFAAEIRRKMAIIPEDQRDEVLENENELENRINAIVQPRLGAYRFSSDGCTVLGAPIGDAEFVNRELTEKLNLMSSEIPTLVQLDARQAFCLLRLCMVPRPQYLARIIECSSEVFFRELQKFDGKVNEALAIILQLPAGNGEDLSVNGTFINGEQSGEEVLQEPRRLAELIRGLPMSEGGLGMPVHSALAVDYRAESRSRTRNFLQTVGRRPDLLNTANRIWAGPDLVDPVFVRAIELHGSEMEEGVSARVRISRRQSSFSTYVEGKLTNDMQKALFLSQQGHGTGRFITWMGSREWMGDISALAFRAGLRERVLCRPAWNHDGRPLMCACNKVSEEQLLTECYNHAHVCELNRGIIKQRHDSVVNALATALKANTHRAEVASKGKEYMVPAELRRQGEEEGNIVRTDVEYALPDGTTYRIDVAVIDPTSVKAISQWHSSTEAGGATRGKAEAKRRHYQGILPEGIGQKMLPFILESSGRLGAEALQFLEEVFPPGDAAARARTQLLKQISLILVRSAGRMVEASWRRMIQI